MGVQIFFDEIVLRQTKEMGETCSIEIVDNHSVPEIRIGPPGEAYKGYITEFVDWKQFERFVDSINSLHSRLEGLHKK